VSAAAQPGCALLGIRRPGGPWVAGLHSGTEAA